LGQVFFIFLRPFFGTHGFFLFGGLNSPLVFPPGDNPVAVSTPPNFLQLEPYLVLALLWRMASIFLLI